MRWRKRLERLSRASPRCELRREVIGDEQVVDVCVLVPGPALLGVVDGGETRRMHPAFDEEPLRTFLIGPCPDVGPAWAYELHHTVVVDAPHRTVGPTVSDEFIEYVHAPNAHLGTVLLVRDEPDAVTLIVMITKPATELRERRDVDSLETIDGAVHLIHRPNPGTVSRNMYTSEWFQSP